MTLDRTVEMAYLLDFYGPLLTERQRRVCEYYWGQDWSLGEIAAEAGVSRQAVHDLLQRAATALKKYESRLGLVGRFQAQQGTLRAAEAGLSEGTPAGLAAAQAALRQLLED